MNNDKESTLQQMHAGNKLLEFFRDEFYRRCSLRYAQLQGSAGNDEQIDKQEIDKHMLSLGYKKEGEGKFSIDNILVWDLFPKNVLRTTRGSIFVIDAEIEETI